MPETTTTEAGTGTSTLSRRERQLRVLMAIHGGLDDDPLPGVEPFLDDAGDMPGPRDQLSRIR